MASSAYEIKKELCEIGRRIYQNGFVAANDGNFSVKINDNEFYCTPTGVSKGFMTPDMILKVDGQGNMLEPNPKYRPSSEFKMHLRVYHDRPDVNAVVHAHPPIATAHACAGLALDSYIMPEAVIALGDVPLTKYGTPSTMEIPDAIAEEIQTHDAVLLQNHGALTMGVNLLTAYFTMESLEFFAKVSYYANQLGGGQEFTCEQLEKLMDVRKKMGLPGRHPGCSKCPNRGTSNCHCLTEKDKAAAACKASAPAASNDLVAEITRRVLAEMGK
ncbi:MAG TPA: class II aldolase/adducin family protein [Caproiciproducens sp.]|nr:class II aldolase/adducin family protein [Caproiciproducens sp.]